MLKSFAKSIAFVSLAVAGLSAASAQTVDWEGDPYGYYRYCDAATCYTYWNAGTPEDPDWIFLGSEPRTPPGGRHEN